MGAADPAGPDEEGEKVVKKITFEEAEVLAKKSDYAWAAVEPEGNEINFADASAFFLEGFEHCLKINSKEFDLLKEQRDCAWRELREIREKIKANPNESTYDEVASLMAKYEESERQNQSFAEQLNGLIDGVMEGV